METKKVYKIYNCQYCKHMLVLAPKRLASNVCCGKGNDTKYRGGFSTIRVRNSRENPYMPLECEEYEPCMPFEDLKEATFSNWNKEGGIYYEVDEMGFKIK